MKIAFLKILRQWSALDLSLEYVVIFSLFTFINFISNKIALSLTCKFALVDILKKDDTRKCFIVYIKFH